MRRGRSNPQHDPPRKPSSSPLPRPKPSSRLPRPKRTTNRVQSHTRQKAAAAKKGSNEKVKPAEEKKRKYDDAGLGKYFEWEHNVTGDCKPSDVLVPFTYHTSRIFNLEPGGVNYLVEKRADPNNVRCSCSTSLLPALTDQFGDIDDLHKISKGQCPYRALQCGASCTTCTCIRTRWARGTACARWSRSRRAR